MRRILETSKLRDITPPEVSLVPIKFQCLTCNKRLSIAERKAGTHTTCPHCNAAVTVPLATTAPAGLSLPPDSSAELLPDRWKNPWVKLVTMGGGIVALLAIALVLLLEIAKPAPPPSVVRIADPTIDPPVSITPLLHHSKSSLYHSKKLLPPESPSRLRIPALFRGLFSQHRRRKRLPR